MSDTYLQYGLLAALAIALLAAAITDIRSRRIANWLTGAIALGAPVFWLASGLSVWPDMAIQLGVAIATFAILAGLFAAGWMGGGDVKLLAALALWVTPANFLTLLLVMALVGGALTIVTATLHTMRRRKDGVTVPYGVAIAAGGLWVLFVNYLPAAGTATSVG